jgi:hypothetical protein
VPFDIKCVIGGLLVTNFNKVWRGEQRVIPRPLADSLLTAENTKGVIEKKKMFFLRFCVISYAAQEKLSIIRIIRINIRIMPKLSVIQIKLFLIRTNTPKLEWRRTGHGIGANYA